jgi:predicted SnoaL-like aldol condensation-catalyzing enzyme
MPGLKKNFLTLSFLLLIMIPALAQDTLKTTGSPDSVNSIDPQDSYIMEIARGFYQDLWFTQNTEAYSKYMADEYIIHDIGKDRNGVESGIVQKEIADFFWENGEMSGEIEYQLTNDDLVATRWIWHYRPRTLLGRFMVGEVDLPIINVFRIREGKIVEVWNHRHDIDTNRTNIFLLKGLLYGLLIAMIPLIWALYLRRKLKKIKAL